MRFHVPAAVHYISPTRAPAFRDVSVKYRLGSARVYAWSPFLVLLLDVPATAITLAIEEEAAVALGQYVDLRPLASFPPLRRAAVWERAAPLVSAALISSRSAGDAR